MDEVRLDNGRMITIRPIRAGDAPALQAAHDRLSPQSKYRRFLTAKPHLTKADARYLVQVDGQDHVAMVATPVDDPDRILAVARFVRLPEDPRTADFAIVVGDAFQQEGIGTKLMEHLSQTAAERGICRFRATVLAENGPAHRLVRGLPGRVAAERHAGPVDEIEVDLAS
jgi:ribosomal protein S18 acetylase RimI-like enzyme